MKMGSKQINTPGNFREDQEGKYKGDRYTKVEKIPGGNVYKFVSTTGEERYAVKQNGKYTTLYKDKGKKEVYKP